MEFLSRDFNAAINIRRRAVLKKRLEERTQSDFGGQPLILDVYREKLEPISSALPKLAERLL
jgi:transposase